MTCGEFASAITGSSTLSTTQRTSSRFESFATARTRTDLRNVRPVSAIVMRTSRAKRSGIIREIKGSGSRLIVVYDQAADHIHDNSAAAADEIRELNEEALILLDDEIGPHKHRDLLEALAR